METYQKQDWYYYSFTMVEHRNIKYIFFKLITAPEKILQLFNKYGDTLRIRIGSKLIILNRDVSITEVQLNYIHEFLVF